MRALPLLLLGSFLASATHGTATANDTAWGLSLGAGAAVSPQYAGDDEYGINVLPYVRVSYSDTFALSVPEGANYKVFQQGPLSLTATAKLAFDRDEDGSAPFRIAGGRTSDLIGLGDVAATPELGGTVDYRDGPWGLSASIRQGIGGHDGLVGEVSARYRTSVRGFGPPIQIGFGPSLNFGDGDYMGAYYGVDAVQSAASGLSQFDAGGGLYSVGLSLSAVMPLTGRSALVFQSSLSQLTGDAANAPLVKDRGSPTQGFVGLFYSYSFGQDARRGQRPPQGQGRPQRP